MSRLALFLLGPPRIECNGEPIEIRRRKAMALIVYLAVTGRGHSRDALATLLWPDHDQSRARAGLRRTQPPQPLKFSVSRSEAVSFSQSTRARPARR
jgi:hypothetical protein